MKTHSFVAMGTAMSSNKEREVHLTERILAEVGPHPRLSRRGRVGHRIGLDKRTVVCVWTVNADGRANVQLWPEARTGMDTLPAGVIRVRAPDRRDPDPAYHSYEAQDDVAFAFAAMRIRDALGIDLRAPRQRANDDFEADVTRLLKAGPVPRPPTRSSPAEAAEVICKEFIRDARVKAWVLQQANGHCERCASPAPFTLANGLPYLEVHHVQRLADGGLDTIENAVALCPNCHRLLHLATDAPQQRSDLYAQVPRLSAHLPVRPGG